jgi:hypothetical protein
VYYDHAQPVAEQPGFRIGAAGVFKPVEGGGFETLERVVLSPNSCHALVEHGITDVLAALPLEVGPLEPGRQALFAPSSLDDVARVLYEADRTTYGRTHDFAIGEVHSPAWIQYRLIVDNREFQRTLARLQFLVTSAGRHGEAVWLQI